MRRLLSAAIVVVAGCDPPPAPKADVAKSSAQPADTPKRVEAPPVVRPAAPPGTVDIDGVYVHTCAEPGACPSLLQEPGEAHCELLTLGSMRWRLPTLQELESWTGNAALTGLDVFHWSGSTWDEDPEQLWIYDPGSGAKTTAKPTRKAFTIRCVAENFAQTAK